MINLVAWVIWAPAIAFMAVIFLSLTPSMIDIILWPVTTLFLLIFPDYKPGNPITRFIFDERC